MENENITESEQDINQAATNDDQIGGETQNLTLAKKQKYFSDGGLTSLLAIFGIAFLLSFFIFQILLVPIKVIGVSMKPTINASVVSNSDEIHCDYVYFSKPYSLSNDDIIIVKNNGYIDDNSEDENFIKRIVACPGQTITFVLEDEIAKTYSCTVKDSNGNVIQINESFLENGIMNLYDPNSPRMLYFSVFPFYQNFYNSLVFHGKFTLTLAENEYFIMGDNRDQSTDSRFFGPVKNLDIVGKVQLQVKYGETLIQSVLEKIKNLI